MNIAALPETTLNITRIIKASRAKVFQAWTNPGLIMKWWGPGTTTCPEASVNLKVGGTIRIANKIENGSVLWIEGEFEEIEKPSLLIYSFKMSTNDDEPSRVTVKFNDHPDGCELILKHERIATQSVRDANFMGWNGCLDGLETLFSK